MSRCWIALLAIAPIFTLGCSTSTSTQGNVAVVDLDKAAEQLGLSQQWTSQLNQQQTKINEQLIDYQQQLNEQLENKKVELAGDVTKLQELPQADQVELVTFQQELNGKLNQAKSQAQQHLTTTRTQIIHKFRNAAKEISLEVALENGYDVVLTKNDTVVFNYSPNSDITTQVVERLQQKLNIQTETAAAQPTPN